MIAARVLHATYRALDHTATSVLIAADWCANKAWRLDPDPRFDDVCDSIQWLQDRDGWPLDPDGYHVDGRHRDET